MLTEATLRKASSLAWWELKNKYPLHKAEIDGKTTTLSLFGDKYKFFFDSERKAAWVESNHHYKNSFNFRLCTAHKNWEGVFSAPRQIVMDRMQQHLTENKESPRGAEEAKRLGIEAKKVCGSFYKGDKHKLARMFGAVLWKHLDREVACLSMKLYGLSAGSFDYTMIANNKEEVQDTLNKAPGILPVWRDMCVYEMYKKRKKVKNPIGDMICDDDEFSLSSKLKSKIDPGEAYGSARGLVDNFDYMQLVSDFQTPNIIKKVKEHLTALGLTKAGWRYLIKLPPRYATKFLLGRRIENEFIPLMNWFAEINVVPRYTLIKDVLRHIQNDRRSPGLTAVMRAGLKKAEKIKGVRAFYLNELQPTLDWFMRAEGAHTRDGVQLDHNQMKANWTWFMRQQEEWHATFAAKEKAKIAQQTWESALDAFKIKGGYEIVPLTSAHQLIDEGKDMHHCVASYASSCMSGRSRIFSILKSGGKVATLELSSRKKSTLPGVIDFPANVRNLEKHAPNLVIENWEVNQVRGSCNSDVSEAVKKVSEQVARLYTKKVNKNGITENQTCGNVEGN